MEALNDVVRAGKARYVGFCNLPAWKVAKANAYADKRGFPRYESAQVYYTIAGRDIEREIVPLAREDQLAIMPWSPLAGGLLSGKFFRDGRGPQGSRRVTFDFPLVDKDRAFDCIEAMQPIAESRGISVAQIALAWLLHQKHVTSVIIGAKTNEQLADNLAAVTVKLTDDELATLDKVSALPREYPGWMLELNRYPFCIYSYLRATICDSEKPVSSHLHSEMRAVLSSQHRDARQELTQGGGLCTWRNNAIYADKLW